MGAMDWYEQGRLVDISSSVLVSRGEGRNTALTMAATRKSVVSKQYEIPVDLSKMGSIISEY